MESKEALGSGVLGIASCRSIRVELAAAAYTYCSDFGS